MLGANVIKQHRRRCATQIEVWKRLGVPTAPLDARARRRGLQEPFVFESDEDQRDRIPVTDPDLDAPDGAVVNGYERHANEWRKIKSKP